MKANYVACLLAAVAAILVGSLSAGAAPVYSNANTHVYDGASGYTRSQWDYTGGPVSDDVSFSGEFTVQDWTTAAKVYADASTGTLRAGSWATCTTHTYSSSTTFFAQSEASMQDYFTVEAGDSGLQTGDPVQIRFRRSIHGRVLLEGNPWSSSQFHFRTELFERPAGGGQVDVAELEVGPISMNPPQDFVVDELLDEMVTVHVGSRLILTSLLKANLGGVSCMDPGFYECINDAWNTGRAQLGYAPGYEDIIITSDSGATILPEPGALCLLALGGLAVIRRRRMA